VIFASAVILASVLAACERTGSGQSGAKTDGAIAATVNGKDIPLKDVDQIINQQTNGQMSQLSPIQQATARIQALDSLIQQEVLFQRAEKEKLLPTDEEVTRAINSQKQQANLTEEEYQKMLQESKQTEQSVREMARKQLAIQKLVDKTVSNVTIKDSEVVDYYTNNKQRFVSQRGVALSAIIADPQDSGGVFQDDAKNDFEAQNKINDIAAALKRGEDFATTARKRSEDQSALRSGDLGFATEEQLKQNRLPQEMVANLMGAMKPGDVTNPVRLDDGRYYIFKITDKRLTTENQTLDTPGVRDQIKELLRSERQRIMGEAMRIVSMNEAKVVNNLATDILKDPNNLGGLSPAQPASASGSPAASNSPAAAAASPAAGATPAAAK
jgi:parvulin-like peptidyl-prolyl isomerase